MKNSTYKSGFTLIELSIVLVIIGLIIGGVLVGQDLIKGAEIRAAVSQIEKYDAAANAFRNKYNGLPGDIASPSTFSFTDSFDTAPNGNGRIQRTTDNGTSFDNEAAAFFRHLSQASLIAESITGTDFTAGNSETLATLTPSSKLSGGGNILVASIGGPNFYVMARGLTYDGSDVTFTANSEIKVIDVLQFDSKLDDGQPTTGRVIAITDMNTADAGAGAADNQCVNTTTNPDSYNTSTTARSNDTECTLRIRTSF
jgi:prepilin-type N-terminal cleavage/methylation domain-containing protein